MTKEMKLGQALPHCALARAIFIYKSEWNRYLAASLDDNDAPRTYESSLDILNNWTEPAGDWISAETALALAIEQYEVGDSNLIPLMMRAAHGYLMNEGGAK